MEGVEESVCSVRSRRRTSELTFCPICGCTLRPGEFRAHLALEVDRLAKLSGPNAKRSSPSAGTSNSVVATVAGEHPPAEEARRSGEVFDRVRRNRERRLRACRSRAASNPAQNQRDTVACPVCDRRVPSAGADAHAEACLARRARNQGDAEDDDDETVDVDGDAPDERFGVSYEWCSQVRVRASALQMLDGGEPPHNAMRVRRASTDTHLVVDGDDDDLLYGPPQYSPRRISAQMDENIESCDGAQVDGRILSESNNNDENRLEDYSMIADPKHEERDDDDLHKNGNNSRIIIETLKDKIRELEQQIDSNCRRSTVKCLICISPYNEPVVSIQCWHVYCEVCWLNSLRAKKTCPQCNAITTSQHLRRIYL